MKVYAGMPLFTDICLAMRSDPLGVIRCLGELVTCLHGPAVTFAFRDPSVATYRFSFTHISLISILDKTTMNWSKQSVLRNQMSNDGLLGKIKDPEMIELNFRAQI